MDGGTAARRRSPGREPGRAGLTRVGLVELIRAEQAKGVQFSVQPSMDQRKLVSNDEAEGGY